MRHLLFPADEILRRAESITIQLHRSRGKTVSIGYEVKGTLLDVMLDGDGDDGLTINPQQSQHAHQLLAALLKAGGAA